MILQGGIEATTPAAWRAAGREPDRRVPLFQGVLAPSATAAEDRSARVRHGDPRHRFHCGVLGDQGGDADAVDMLAMEGARVNVRSNAARPGDVAPGVQATPAGFADHARIPPTALPSRAGSAKRATPPRSRGRPRRRRPHERRHDPIDAGMGARDRLRRQDRTDRRRDRQPDEPARLVIAGVRRWSPVPSTRSRAAGCRCFPR
jgi:hypothetical protein